MGLNRCTKKAAKQRRRSSRIATHDLRFFRSRSIKKSGYVGAYPLKYFRHCSSNDFTKRLKMEPSKGGIMMSKSFNDVKNQGCIDLNDYGDTSTYYNTDKRYKWPKDEIEELLVEDFETRFVEKFSLNLKSRKPKTGTRGGWVKYGTTKEGSAYSINVLERRYHCHNGMGSGSMWSFYAEYTGCTNHDFSEQCEAIGRFIGYSPYDDDNDDIKKAQAKRIAEIKERQNALAIKARAEAEELAREKASKGKSEINQNREFWRSNLAEAVAIDALIARGFSHDDIQSMPDCIGAYAGGFVFYQDSIVKYMPSDFNTGKRLKDHAPIAIGGNLALNLASHREGERVALVEGEFDALSMWKMGFPAIAIKSDHGYERLKLVIDDLTASGRYAVAMYDADEAGERFREKAIQLGALDAGTLADVWQLDGEGDQLKDANDFLIDIRNSESSGLDVWDERIAHLRNKLECAKAPDAPDVPDAPDEMSGRLEDYPLNKPEVRHGIAAQVMREMANIWANSYRLIEGRQETMLGLKSGIIYGEKQTRRLLSNEWRVFTKDAQGRECVQRISWNDAITAIMPYTAYCKPRWVYTQPPCSFYHDENGELCYNRCKPLAPIGIASSDDRQFGERLLSFIIDRFKTQTEAAFWLNWLLDARANTARKPGVINNYRATETGTGKNTLGKLIPQFFVGKIHCGEQSGYPSKFAADRPLQTLLFAMYDEVWQDNRAYSRLKNLATESPVTVEFKGATPIMCDSSTRISTGSNDAVDFIEDGEDRRSNLFELTKKINENPIIDELKAIISKENTEMAANRRAGFMDVLTEYCKAHGANVRKAIDTRLKQDTRVSSILSDPVVSAALLALGWPAHVVGLSPKVLAEEVSKALRQPVTAKQLGYALRRVPEYVTKDETGKMEDRRWRLTEKGRNLVNDDA